MKRVIWRALAPLLALTLVAAFALSVAPAVSAHPAQTAQSPQPQIATVCSPDTPLSDAALKKQLKAMGAEGAYLIAHMKKRFTPDPTTQCQIGKTVDPQDSLVGPDTVKGQFAPGALTSTQNGRALPAGTGCPCDRTDIHWGGYYVDETSGGTNTNGVQSNFNAEFVSCSVCYFYTWVGVGGVNGNGDLDQVGINMESHFAWWCTWDDPNYRCEETGTTLPTRLFNVSQGDNIWGFVARYSPGIWEFTIEDTTNGQYFNTTYGWSPDHTTADWIVELSNSQNGSMPSFNDITFGGAYWYDSNGNPYGAIHDIADNAQIDSIENYLSGTYYAEPGATYDGGIAFTYYFR